MKFDPRVHQGANREIADIGVNILKKYGIHKCLILSGNGVYDQGGKLVCTSQAKDPRSFQKIPNRIAEGIEFLNAKVIDWENLDVKYVAVWMKDNAVQHEIFSASHKILKDKATGLSGSGVLNWFGTFHDNGHRVTCAADLIADSLINYGDQIAETYKERIESQKIQEIKKIKFKHVLSKMTFGYLGTNKEADVLGMRMLEKYGPGEYLILTKRAVYNQYGKRVQKYKGLRIDSLKYAPHFAKRGVKAMNQHKVGEENLNVKYIVVWTSDKKGTQFSVNDIKPTQSDLRGEAKKDNSTWHEIFSDSHSILKDSKINLSSTGPLCYENCADDVTGAIYASQNAVRFISCFLNSFAKNTAEIYEYLVKEAKGGRRHE